jgi:glycosidase
VIYLLMVDRFANGDPTNDGTIDPADPQAFHGGDLDGVAAHLDGLADIGVDQLWLTPISHMRTEKFYEWGAYHGYWMEDPAELEPRFGDEAALDRLAAGLRDHGIQLFLDLVTNHVAPDSRLTTEHPAWFHHFGPIRNWHDSAEVITHDVHGLPDLDQSNPEVYGWLRDAALHWMDRVHPAGFRLDAVRHVPSDFLARLGDELRARAPVKLWGEVFDGDVTRVEATRKAAKLDAVFDYPLHYALVDVVCQDAPAGAIPAALDRSNDTDPAAWITFLDNHDTARIASACRGDSARVDRALRLLFALRGTPMISWGTEYDLPGEKEPENRADMPWTRPTPVARLSLVRELARQRRETPSLRGGRFRTLAVGEHWFCLETTLGDERRWVVYNGSERAIELGGISFDAGAVVVYQPEFARIKPPRAGVTRFELNLGAHGVVDEGDEVRLVGDAPELGAWDPAKGISLPGSVKLEAEAYLYKLVIVHADGRPPTWASGPNRVQVGGGGTVWVRWSG